MANQPNQYDFISNHIEIAQGRQVWQYKGKDNFDKWIKIKANRLQILENLLAQLRDERALNTSVGAQLDLLASDYNITREFGESDDDLRLRINIEIDVLKNFGQVEALIFALNRLVTPRSTALNQVFPLSILMWIFVDDFAEISETESARINSAMQQIKAAGVRLEIGLQLNSSAFRVTDDPLNGTVGAGVATLIDGSDGGAFVKSLV